MKATIVENYTLPSKGLIYDNPINPDVTIRSMTLAEEMRRLQSTDETYRPMSEVIDDCIENKLPMSSYDMCLGDYQYLLHKLRVVTYGQDYKLSVVCPVCGEVNEIIVKLDELKVNELPDNYQDLMTITLPRTGDTVKIKFQTPRMLDRIVRDRREMKKQFPDLKGDPNILLTIQNTVDEINGRKMTPQALQEYLKNLPMMDASYLTQAIAKLSDCVGINPAVSFTCKNCGVESPATFRFTSEFFTPTY